MIFEVNRRMGETMGGVVQVALGVLASATFATGASAGDPRVTIYPPNAKAGDKVSIYVHECSTTTTDIYASSMAFEGRHVLLARNGGQGGWMGSVEIDDEADSTAHEVVVRCSNRYIKAYLTVNGRGGYPRVGPDTGGGGLAMPAAESESVRTIWLMAAVGVLIAASGLGVVAARRRRGQ